MERNQLGQLVAMTKIHGTESLDDNDVLIVLKKSSDAHCTLSAQRLIFDASAVRGRSSMPALADGGLKAECDRCGVVPNANQNCTRSALTVQQLIANVMCAGFESHHDGF